MESLREVFTRTASRATEKKSNLDEIKQLFEEYSCEGIPIKKCLAKTGRQTAELIIYQVGNVNVSDRFYDNIVLLITNYYAMLHIADLNTEYYVPNKKTTFDQITALMEEVLAESIQNRGLKRDNFNEAMNQSRDYTRQFVEVYYKAGLEGCLKYLTSSIYSLLLHAKQASALKKKKIERIIRAIQAEKVLYTR